MVTGALGALSDIGIQVAVGMAHGQSFGQSLNNVNLGSVAVSFGASAAGYGFIKLAGRAAEAYELYRVGKSATKVIYAAEEGAARTTWAVPKVATTVVKEEMVESGVQEASRIATAVAVTQAMKLAAKAAVDQEKNKCPEGTVSP